MNLTSTNINKNSLIKTQTQTQAESLIFLQREKRNTNTKMYSNTLIKTHLTVSTNIDGDSFLQNLNPNPKKLEMGEGESVEMGESESDEKFRRWR